MVTLCGYLVFTVFFLFFDINTEYLFAEIHCMLSENIWRLSNTVKNKNKSESQYVAGTKSCIKS